MDKTLTWFDRFTMMLTLKISKTLLLLVGLPLVFLFNCLIAKFPTSPEFLPVKATDGKTFAFHPNTKWIGFDDKVCIDLQQLKQFPNMESLEISCRTLSDLSPISQFGKLRFFEDFLKDFFILKRIDNDR